jgi:hypothetical protein
LGEGNFFIQGALEYAGASSEAGQRGSCCVAFEYVCCSPFEVWGSCGGAGRQGGGPLGLIEGLVRENLLLKTEYRGTL